MGLVSVLIESASTKRIKFIAQMIPQPKAIHRSTPPPTESPIVDRRDATAKIKQIAIGRIIAPEMTKAIVWRGIGGRSMIVFPISPILLILSVNVKDVLYQFYFEPAR